MSCDPVMWLYLQSADTDIRVLRVTTLLQVIGSGRPVIDVNRRQVSGIEEEEFISGGGKTMESEDKRSVFPGRVPLIPYTPVVVLHYWLKKTEGGREELYMYNVGWRERDGRREGGREGLYMYNVGWREGGLNRIHIMHHAISSQLDYFPIEHFNDITN